jgi:5'-3' exonuclease
VNISIIDGNSLGYASHYATKLHSGEQETQAVFGVFNTLLTRRVKYPDSQPLVVWDGRATWRFEKCPTYKSNRHSDDPKKEAIREAYKTQVPYIQELLKSLGVRQILCSTHEADDLAGLIVSKKKPQDRITLVTGDHDWLQLIRNNVLFYDIRSEQIVDANNFFSVTKYRTPEAFLDGKCLRGDSSDAISGVGGIGEKGAVSFLSTYGNVQNFFNAVDSGVVKPRTKALIHLASDEGREIYHRNYEVMQLLKVAPIDKKNLILANGHETKNYDNFIRICQELAFTSILNNAENIFKRF